MSRPPELTPEAKRLREARAAAGYATAADAARAMGVKAATYTHHENGTAGLSRAGARYARFFGVSLDWLLAGRGEMRARAAPAGALTVPLDGVVGAGARVDLAAEADAMAGAAPVALPGDGALGALRVCGDSMYPRCLDGETILYDRRPLAPEALVDRLAIVQLVNGDRLVKTLRRDVGDSWALESHAAPLLRHQSVLAVWRVVALLTA